MVTTQDAPDFGALNTTVLRFDRTLANGPLLPYRFSSWTYRTQEASETHPR